MLHVERHAIQKRLSQSFVRARNTDGTGALGGCGVLACPHTTAVHVQRSSGAVHDLVRDHDLLDALEAR
jgi:hypothetical protein